MATAPTATAPKLKRFIRVIAYEQKPGADPTGVENQFLRGDVVNPERPEYKFGWGSIKEVSRQWVDWDTEVVISLEQKNGGEKTVPETKVHIFHMGSAFCSEVKGAPWEWPEGHTWVPQSHARKLGAPKLCCARCWELFEQQEEQVQP